MDKLFPNELINLIFNNIDNIKHKRNFLRTCNKYYVMSKILMINYKYAVFITNCTWEGDFIFDLRGVFDNLNICRSYIKAALLKNPVKHSSVMNKENDYTIIGKRCNCDYNSKFSTNGFLIEEIIINEFI